MGSGALLGVTLPDGTVQYASIGYDGEFACCMPVLLQEASGSFDDALKFVQRKAAACRGDEAGVAPSEADFWEDADLGDWYGGYLYRNGVWVTTALLDVRTGIPAKMPVEVRLTNL